MFSKDDSTTLFLQELGFTLWKLVQAFTGNYDLTMDSFSIIHPLLEEDTTTTIT